MLLLVALTAIICCDLSFAFPPSHFERRVDFSSDQLINVQGVHPFRPPGDNDFRGPCPDLNALANHNYISHTGIDTLANLMEQSVRVFAVGQDIAIILGALGPLRANLFNPALPLSIGGAPPPDETIWEGLGSAPSGLSGTHNQFEIDMSPARGDLYQFGNNYDVHNPFFQALFDQLQSPCSNYDLSVLCQHSQTRFVANNPYFFHGPVEMLVSVATHLFVPALMSNHSAAQPDGYLDKEVLKSFYGMNGPDGNLSYRHGYERIPDNWFRRPFGQEYTLAIGVLDVVKLAFVAPDVITVGGNVNGTNSYAPVDISDLTGGVYSAASLPEGNNAACFLIQATTTLFPSAIKGIAGTLIAPLVDLLEPILVNLACPQLTTIDTSLLEVYPGYQRRHNPI
ncbi:Chloroperoxidase [Mycena galopus ATCC 62051]|nr:Chloroperoxidase [Mycena galopus ATCC 62051]